MEMPIMTLYFNIYHEDGAMMATDVEMGSVTLYDYYDNLNVIHKKFFEKFNHPMMIWNTNWRYASPMHIKDYMFDVKTGELLPNRFLK